MYLLVNVSLCGGDWIGYFSYFEIIYHSLLYLFLSVELSDRHYTNSSDEWNVRDLLLCARHDDTSGALSLRQKLTTSAKQLAMPLYSLIV